MSDIKKGKTKAPQLDKEAVASFLKQSPDFFKHYPEVLEDLRLQHKAGSAVSLIERQVELLRSRNSQMRARLEDLVGIAEENEQRMQKLNRLACGLLAADEGDARYRAAGKGLRKEFEVDEVFLIGRGALESPQGEMGLCFFEADADCEQAFDGVFRAGKPVCDPLTGAQQKVLYPDQGEKLEKSAAAIPMPGELGVIVLVSQDAERFRSGMGTLFLELTAELVAAALPRRQAAAAQAERDAG